MVVAALLVPSRSEADKLAGDLPREARMHQSCWLLWATGAGADATRRAAAPMMGGVATSFVMELLVYPVLFYQAKRFTLRREPRVAAAIPLAADNSQGC